MFSTRRPDAARQLDGVRVGGQRLLGRIERSWRVLAGILDRGTKVLRGINGSIGLDGGRRSGRGIG